MKFPNGCQQSHGGHCNRSKRPFSSTSFGFAGLEHEFSVVSHTPGRITKKIVVFKNRGLKGFEWVYQIFPFTQNMIKVQMSSQSWYGFMSHSIQVRGGGRWWLCLNAVFSHQMARMFLSAGPESLKHGNPNLQLMDMTFGAGGHTDVILNHQLADRVRRLVVCDCDR